MPVTKPKKQISLPIVPVVIPADAVFLTARELAGLLRKTSLKSVYRLAKKNLISHVHESGGLLFARKSVDEYLAARLVVATPLKEKNDVQFDQETRCRRSSHEVGYT